MTEQVISEGEQVHTESPARPVTNSADKVAGADAPGTQQGTPDDGDPQAELARSNRAEKFGKE